MEDFDQSENKRDFGKMILIIGGVVLLAAVVSAFLLLKKGSKDTFNPEVQNPNTLVSPTIPSTEKPIFPKDITTWSDYYWPGKINTHYPSDWQLTEETNKDGLVVGMKITPPTGNADDVIFIGGASVKCSNVLKYSKNKCLKNKIQVPFYIPQLLRPDSPA